MHLNISSLQHHLDELSFLIDKSKTKFSIIGITESCLNKDIARLKNINLQNYSIQHTPGKNTIIGCIYKHPK